MCASVGPAFVVTHLDALLMPPLPSPRRPDRRPTAASRDPSPRGRRAALGYRRMVRERVGDWRSAWRSALAGFAAGLLVAGVIQAGLFNPTFAATQDQLFPAPPPDPRITLVALDQASANNLGGYPLISNAYHAQVIDYLMSLNPSVILFDIPLNRITAPDPETKADTNQPLIDALTRAALKTVLVCTPDLLPWPQFEVGEAVGERSLAVPDAANSVRG